MSSTLRNVLAVVAGVVVGGAVNMALISVSGSVIPLPEGVDPADLESLKANIDRFEPRHFLMPFLAHALGTLVGAFLAARLAASRRTALALGIGVFFLFGGVANAFLLPAPVWFLAADLLLAYLPMAWIGGRLGRG
jgi:uncharacterized membrane protein YqgA involved in biofilm formation